jgi:AcrR family transcriptional regulator
MDQLGDEDKSSSALARRTARAERILDAAAALILRWGYNKTTIDDIARQAGVAKGTIYLHWKTREELFLALMQRERLTLAEDVQQRLAADPLGMTLHGMFKHSALALMQRPLIKAALTRDIGIVGKLVHSEHSQALLTERVAGFTAYLEALRAHGLARTDVSLPAQVYTVSAIFMGFVLIEPFMPDELTPSAEERAELMADAVRRAVEVDGVHDTAVAQAVTDALQRYLKRDKAAVQDDVRQRIEEENRE